MTSIETKVCDFLQAGRVKDIAALIEVCDLPQDAFFLAEQIPREAINATGRQELLQFARVSMLKKHNTAGIDPACYTSGRVFCPQFELRWHTDSHTGETRVVYLGEQERPLPGLIEATDLKKLREELRTLKKTGDARYYLFGTTLDTSPEGRQLLKQRDLDNKELWRYYAEMRIPRLLRYPSVGESGGKRRVQLTVCEYIEQETGSVRLFRFQKLEPAV